MLSLKQTDTHTHTNVYIYKMRESARYTKRERERERGWRLLLEPLTKPAASGLFCVGSPFLYIYIHTHTTKRPSIHMHKKYIQTYMRMAHQSKSRDKRTNWERTDERTNERTKIKRHYVEKIQSVHKQAKSNVKNLYVCVRVYVYTRVMPVCAAVSENVYVCVCVRAARRRLFVCALYTYMYACLLCMFMCLCVLCAVVVVYKPIEIDLT